MKALIFDRIGQVAREQARLCPAGISPLFPSRDLGNLNTAAFGIPRPDWRADLDEILQELSHAA